MNLAQRKLTKAEWEGIEIPVSLDEKKILNMIKNGFENISTRYNDTKSLQSYIKTENAEELQSYMFEKYFLETIKKLNKKYDLGFDITKSKKIKLKKKDIIRIENFEAAQSLGFRTIHLTDPLTIKSQIANHIIV